MIQLLFNFFLVIFRKYSYSGQKSTNGKETLTVICINELLRKLYSDAKLSIICSNELPKALRNDIRHQTKLQ